MYKGQTVIWCGTVCSIIDKYVICEDNLFIDMLRLLCIEDEKVVENVKISDVKVINVQIKDVKIGASFYFPSRVDVLYIKVDLETTTNNCYYRRDNKVYYISGHIEVIVIN